MWTFWIQGPVHTGNGLGASTVKLLPLAVNSDSPSLPPNPPTFSAMGDASLRYLLLLFISHGLVVFPLSYSFRKLKVSP